MLGSVCNVANCHRTRKKKRKYLDTKALKQTVSLTTGEITVLGGVQSFNAGQVFNGETADQISLFGNIGDRVMPAFPNFIRKMDYSFFRSKISLSRSWFE